MKHLYLAVAGILCLSVAGCSQAEQAVTEAVPEVVEQAMDMQPDADLEMYSQWMQSIRGSVRSLNSNLEAQTADAVATDARALAGVFGEVHDFWVAKGVNTAMQFAMDAQAGFNEAAELAEAGNLEGATEAVTKARTNCGGCHEAHRIRHEDGSFEIKY